jgi:hypothetical protein
VSYRSEPREEESFPKKRKKRRRSRSSLWIFCHPHIPCVSPIVAESKVRTLFFHLATIESNPASLIDRAAIPLPMKTSCAFGARCLESNGSASLVINTSRMKLIYSRTSGHIEFVASHSSRWCCADQSFQSRVQSIQSRMQSLQSLIQDLMV